MDTATKARISDRVSGMEESATLKMARLSRELSAQGKKVISLSLGEPDFDTPEHIKQAAKEALDAGYTKYTPVPGIPELREAISQKFKRENKLDYAPDQIVVSNGAKQSIANLSLALLNPGDEVIIFSPFWVSYMEIVKLGGGVPVLVDAGIEQDFKVSPKQVKEALSEKTKFVLFSSPCNPTGSVFLKEELEAIAEVLAPYEDVLVVSDEIYEHINFSGKHCSIGTIPSLRNRTITVNGFSKGFAMTGWRLGYMGAPKWVADACNKIQGQFTSGANAFGQKAAVTALEASLQPTHDMRAAFLKRRDMMLNLLSEIPGIKVNKPLGAFYIFPNIEDFFGKSSPDGKYTIQSSDDFCEYLLMEAHVAVVTGAAFGNPNCFRISYAASEKQLREAVQRMKDVLGKLN